METQHDDRPPGSTNQSKRPLWLLAGLLVVALLFALPRMGLLQSPPTEQDVRLMIQDAFPTRELVTLGTVLPKEPVRVGEGFRIPIVMDIRKEPRDILVHGPFEMPWMDEGERDPIRGSRELDPDCEYHVIRRDALFVRDDAGDWRFERYEPGKGSVECGALNVSGGVPVFPSAR